MAEIQNGNERKIIKKGYALFASFASIVTVTILIIVKGFAYLQSGSVSILASLTDSMIDAAASLINFLAIRYSLKPADHEHRFGHGKVEGLAALAQGAFIAGAGVFLILESLQRFTRPEQTEDSMLAIIVMGFSVIMSLVLILIQKISLKYAPSLAVEAEQAHYAGDVLINGGVLAVLLALRYGGPLWLDPAFAIMVAFYLGYTAWNIAMKGLDMLLDRELPDEMRARIREIVKGHDEVIGMHDLRTRKSGMNVYISFDIELEPDQTLRQAHEVIIALEKELLILLPNADILIHKDPAGIHHTDSRHQVSGVHDQ